MEKEIVWTVVARSDFWEIVSYLKENWPIEVLDKFSYLLKLKSGLLIKEPNIGFKSSRYSRFRKTFVSKHYAIIYSITKEHIIIHRLKHTSMK